MSALNIAALALFAICWLFYQPLLKLLSRGYPCYYRAHAHIPSGSRAVADVRRERGRANVDAAGAGPAVSIQVGRQRRAGRRESCHGRVGVAGGADRQRTEK